MWPLLRASFAVLLLAVTVYGQLDSQLGVTATNVLNFVYHDGIQQGPLPNNGDWMIIDRHDFDPDTRLIAVRANNIAGGCSGIMVSSFNSPNEILSDRNWKCSATPANGWQNLGFDDSSWEPAVEIALNGEIVTGCSWFIIPDMPLSAYWIWTSAHLDGDQIVSCRGVTTVCEKSPCQNGATCNQNAPGPLCTCPVRWQGKYCDEPLDECGSNPCQNGGQCEHDDSGYVCKCSVGFTGVNCETDTTDCASAPCQNGGTCNFDVDGGYTCSCLEGYTGLDCETDIDECASAPCRNGATCNDQVNGVTCTCVPGYTGILCEIDINECMSNPCLSASTCEDLVNGYQCHCHPGHTGANCETPIGECANFPCFNGGMCTLGGPGGSVQCICTPGWSGPLCNSNENECLSDPCRNGGTCIDGDNEYTCYCADEFEGESCQFVKPNCGDIMKTSGFPPVNGFQALCEINVVEHPNNLNTPCRDLIKGINFYNDSDTILAFGGNFGCFATRFVEDVNMACIPNYEHDRTLSSCISCSYMGVCLRFPDPITKKSSFPINRIVKQSIPIKK